MPSIIPGYQITKEAVQEGKHITYEAVRENDKKPILIKTLAMHHPRLDDVARLKNEYELLNSLNLNSIIKAYSLEQHENNYYLILEDLQVITLQNYILNNPLNIENGLKIAIGIVKILGDLQANDVIHKNIQPENILINPNTLEIKLTGFSYATRIQRQRLSLKNPNMLEGTLAYMSPEQTGRMNREIDYRTDFYSLGVTFYELFTMQLPFKSKDPMELVHAHIAKAAIPPNQVNPNIPQLISDIIMKLMAKKAEDRYSSSFSLLHDLEKAEQELLSKGVIEPFPLGTNDVFHKLQISQKIYGREKEVNEILKIFDEVCHGSSQMIYISGYSGIGKTSIVNEIHKQILEKKGFFISGKYDQYKANVPYSGFLAAFQDLIQQILTENDETIANWREKLNDALGNNMGMIMDLIPELRYIMGDRPPSKAFDAQETNDKFNYFFQRFISLYASTNSPMVIFLDDLQWIDSASLQLLEKTFTLLNTQGLLLIGAYRSNEVSVLHPLSSTTQRMLKAGAQIKNIEVHPLKSIHVEQLIADSLRISQKNCSALSSIVFEKTQGNPFFINQFLTYLYEEKLLYVDKDKGIWTWDLSKIKALDVSENVIDLLITKLQKCSIETQQTLEMASCIGNSFDVRLLPSLAKKSLNFIMSQLMQAIKEGFILSSEDVTQYLWLDSDDMNYFKPAAQKPQAFRFLHDKVQQATYQLMNEEQRKHTHYQIGRILLDKYQDKEREEHIFDIMAQLNHAADFIKEANERKEYAKMNLMAAQKAMRTGAYPTAYEFSKTGIQFLPYHPWENEYALCLQLFLVAAESSYLSFNYEDANKYFDAILKYANSSLDKAEVCSLRVKLYINASANHKETIPWGLLGLKYLGIDIPNKHLKLHVIKEFVILRKKLFGKDILSLANLPTITDKRQIEVINLISLLLPPVYLSDPNLFALIVIRGLNLTLEYGNCSTSAYIYTSFAVILHSLFEDFRPSIFSFSKVAEILNEKFEDKKYVPVTKFLVGAFIHPNQNPLKSSVEILRQGFELALEQADFLYTIFNLGMMIMFKHMSGVPISDMLNEVNESLKLLKISKLTGGRNMMFFALKQHYLALTNLTNAPNTFNSTDFDEDSFFQMLVDNNYHYSFYTSGTYRVQLSYLFEDYEKGLDYVNRCEKINFTVRGQPMRIENDFYHALILTATYSSKSPITQKKYIKQIDSILKRMRKYSMASSANYLHKFLLVSAELARIQGKKSTAIDFYDQAIEIAKEDEFCQNAAIASELFGNFYLEQNKKQLARKYILDALYLFYKWGATAKVEQIKFKYQDLLKKEDIKLISTPERQEDMFEIFESSRNKDLMTVIQATNTISGEIMLNRLFDELMQIVIQTANADKAMILLEQDEQWFIEAEINDTSKNKNTLIHTPYKQKENEYGISIVNHVIRTKEVVIVNDVFKDSQFIDQYIKASSPSSIACFPLQHQGKLIGILYLENISKDKIFLHSHMDVLRLLSVDIASALVNSILYSQQKELSQELEVTHEKLEDYSHNLEKKVDERTLELNLKHQQLEDRLIQINEMQKKLIQQEKFVSMMPTMQTIATEIRNPLSYVYNFSTLTQELLEEIKPEINNIETFDKLKMTVEKIYEFSKKADQIITLSLEHSKEGELQTELTDVNQLICDYTDMVFDNYRKQEKNLPVLLETSFDPNLEKIYAIQQNLGKVFYHIVDNSIYAMLLKEKNKPGKYKPILKITTVDEANDIAIVIKDNGVGIPKDILARAFSPFLRTKQKENAAGMGLSISHDIIHEHGGSIQINSEEGKFTEVKIFLPKFIKQASA